MPEPIVFPLDLNEVRDTWITKDTYGRLCGESRLYSQSDIAELLEGLRRVRPGDVVQLVHTGGLIKVDSAPTLAQDSAEWSFDGHDPDDPDTKPHSMRGNALLRLWTRRGDAV